MIMDCHTFCLRNNGLAILLAKAMKTCFKAILVIITHAVEGFLTVHYEN